MSIPVALALAALAGGIWLARARRRAR
jgi:hypothetical protein